MSLEDSKAAEVPRHLLEATVEQFFSPRVTIKSLKPVEISQGSSGAQVRRYELDLENIDGDLLTMRLVTKEAPLVERRVLQLLNVQGHSIIPYAHSTDLTTDAPVPLCLQDVGDEKATRSAQELPTMARGIASIHYTNSGKELSWLPRVDYTFFSDYVVDGCWRPAWDEMKAGGSLTELGSYVSQVEETARRLPDMMAAISDWEEALTLVHTDICLPHVLSHNGKPFLIDWQQARYGPFFLDLPSYFNTVPKVEAYRDTLDGLGLRISPARFATGYRSAQRLFALRYLRWPLQRWISWQTPAHRDELRRYLRLIVDPNDELMQHRSNSPDTQRSEG